jgi:hypothetical protein
VRSATFNYLDQSQQSFTLDFDSSKTENVDLVSANDIKLSIYTDDERQHPIPLNDPFYNFIDIQQSQGTLNSETT